MILSCSAMLFSCSYKLPTISFNFLPVCSVTWTISFCTSWYSSAYLLAKSCILLKVSIISFFVIKILGFAATTLLISLTSPSTSFTAASLSSQAFTFSRPACILLILAVTAEFSCSDALLYLLTRSFSFYSMSPRAFLAPAS